MFTFIINWLKIFYFFVHGWIIVAVIILLNAVAMQDIFFFLISLILFVGLHYH